MAATSDRGTGGLAERYASALLELAEERNELDAVAEDLTGVGRMIEQSDDLQRLIRSPLLGRELQGKAMSALLERSGVGGLTRRFVLVAAQNRRLFALPQMIRAYLGELARRRGEVTAEVTAAKELDEGQRSALTEALRKAVGSKVTVDLKVDPDLIGGLVVKVGSRMVDSSLRSKLQRLQLAMKGVG